MNANFSKTCQVEKCYANFFNIHEPKCFTFSIESSERTFHYQCARTDQIIFANLSLSFKENLVQDQNLPYHGVFVFNTLILLLSGIINILLCKRLRRPSELHAEVSDPSPPDTPEPDFSSSLNQDSLNPNYTTLQFPENNARRESSETEPRMTRKDTIYSSLKCQMSMSDITEES